MSDNIKYSDMDKEQMDLLGITDQETLDRYLVNCFISEVAEDYDVDKRELLNVWRSVNRSFSLSNILEDVNSDSNSSDNDEDSEVENNEDDDDDYYHETTFSFENVKGCEGERYTTIQREIAQDIHRAIGDYMTDHYSKYMSDLNLPGEPSYELAVDGDTVDFCVNGPKHEVDAIVLQISNLITNLYNPNESYLSKIIDRLYNYYYSFFTPVTQYTE